MFSDTIKVKYEVYASSYAISTKLPELFENYDILAFDTETRSLYDVEERKEAAGYAKTHQPADEYYKQAMMVSASSGLSFPKITRTTHFIFGVSREKSIILVCNTPELEMLVWNIISKYKGTLIVHNALFDLKIMFHRLGVLPVKFIDTAVYARCLINHTKNWMCKVSLKDLMAPYYSPNWLKMDDYEPKNLKESSFLMYAAIDGAATFYCWELLQDMAEEFET